MALRMKGETVDEIAGLARVMREAATARRGRRRRRHVVGTGGDGAGTFNISTARASWSPRAGARVAKHGNRGVPADAARRRAGGARRRDRPAAGGRRRVRARDRLGFMFAPVYHPAMRHAVGPRREIGVRTVFNILGPLTNPAGAAAS